MTIPVHTSVKSYKFFPHFSENLQENITSLQLRVLSMARLEAMRLKVAF